MEGTAAADVVVVPDIVVAKVVEVWRGMQFDFETQVRSVEVAEAGSPADL